MSPGAFLRVVNRIAPEIDNRCAAETRDGLAAILQNIDTLEKPVQAAIIAVCNELFVRIGAAKRPR
jgi:hypothetical protein